MVIFVPRPVWKKPWTGGWAEPRAALNAWRIWKSGNWRMTQQSYCSTLGATLTEQSWLTFISGLVKYNVFCSPFTRHLSHKKWPLLSLYILGLRWSVWHVNRMPQNRLPRVMKYYTPMGRRNHGRPLKRLLDTWDQNGSTGGTTLWQILLLLLL